MIDLLQNLSTRARLAIILFAVAVNIVPNRPFSELNNIPHINSGGCGFVAYYLNGPVERIGDHYMVRRNGRLVDSRGTWGVLSMLVKGEEVSREELRKRLDNTALWNEAFDRKDTLLIIKYLAE